MTPWEKEEFIEDLITEFKSSIQSVKNSELELVREGLKKLSRSEISMLYWMIDEYTKTQQ